MHSFCLDMGGTGTRAALFAPDGTEIARTTTGPGAISLGTDTTETALRTAWDALAPPVAPARVSLAIGLAGIGLRDRVAALDARLADFASTAIVGDGYGPLLAATGGGPGALIAIGTGVAAMRLLPDGRVRTLSGWGFPAGDLGSGAWIGMQAVAALTRHLDGVRLGPALTPALAETLVQALGGTAAAIMEATAGRPARAFAALAPYVLDAAATDPAAATILARAAEEIAAVGAALHEGAPGDIHLTGGLAPSLAPLVRAAAPARGWHVTPADPLAGLALLARGLAPPERLVHRPGLPAPDY